MTGRVEIGAWEARVEAGERVERMGLWGWKVGDRTWGLRCGGTEGKGDSAWESGPVSGWTV